MAKNIMIQGTMSNAGKSLLAAGLCRIFKQDGYRAAPFKSQNMALNSFITAAGGEMGRAQVVQAEAAGTAPDVRMNPILLKPTTDMGSQVIVNGVVQGNMRAVEYYRRKPEFFPAVLEAYRALGLRKTVVMTPYPEETNQAEKKFLEDNGLEATSITGVGFNRTGEFAHSGKHFLYREAKKLKTEGAEVFFLSCMGLATMELIQILEEDLGMPVITSHQASLWACLRHSRVHDKLPGLGKLFTI